jgi:hypothetical protein
MRSQQSYCTLVRLYTSTCVRVAIRPAHCSVHRPYTRRDTCSARVESSRRRRMLHCTASHGPCHPCGACRRTLQRGNMLQCTGRKAACGPRCNRSSPSGVAIHDSIPCCNRYDNIAAFVPYAAIDHCDPLKYTSRIPMDSLLYPCRARLMLQDSAHIAKCGALVATAIHRVYG